MSDKTTSINQVTHRLVAAVTVDRELVKVINAGPYQIL